MPDAQSDLLIFISAFASGDDGAVHAYRLKVESAEMTLLQRATDVEQPFFLALSPDRRFLYSIHEFAEGRVAAFNVNVEDGQLALLNHQSSGGEGTCYVDVDATGKTLVVANYNGGSVAALPIEADGSLGEPSSFFQHEGSSVNPARQKEPHAHSFVISPDNSYAYAADLVTGLNKVADFEVSVAAYPETHPTASSADADLDNLKRKIDAGAVRAITQYFFDGDVYLRFMDRVHAAGVNVPVVPGILPVTNFAQVRKFSAMCGTSVPQWMADLFEGLDDDPETRKLVAATVAAEQCRMLQANGVNEFHFYTLNRADLAYAITHFLGLRPADDDQAETGSRRTEA